MKALNDLMKRFFGAVSTSSDGGDVGLVGVKSIPSIAYNRNINAAAITHIGNDATNTKNTAFWTATLNIRNLALFCINEGTAAAYQDDDAVLFVVNAPDAATAKAWLEDIGGSEADVKYSVAKYNEVIEFSQDADIVRLDVLPLTEVSRIIVEASQ